jgi:hypothetical protein
MGHTDPAAAIRKLVADNATPRRVTTRPAPEPSNAAPVILVFGGHNVIAPAAPPAARKPRRRA